MYHVEDDSLIGETRTAAVVLVPFLAMLGKRRRQSISAIQKSSMLDLHKAEEGPENITMANAHRHLDKNDVAGTSERILH